MNRFSWARVSGGLLFAALWSLLALWGFYAVVDHLGFFKGSLAYFLLFFIWLLGTVWLPLFVALAVPLFRQRLKLNGSRKPPDR